MCECGVSVCGICVCGVYVCVCVICQCGISVMMYVRVTSVQVVCVYFCRCVAGVVAQQKPSVFGKWLP